MHEKSIVSAVLGLCFLAMTATNAAADKRVALVIGNSAYKSVPALLNPKNDAAALAATFKQAGFDVVDYRPDATKDDLRKALRSFADQARDADIAVVYYAGHGVEVDGTNYIIPVDATLERDTDVLDETYPIDRVLVAIEPARQLRLIILDACRDNPFTKKMTRTIGSRGITRGLAKVEPNSPNTLIAFAAKAGSTASDGGGKNSPFARALVTYIAQPGLDLRKAFGFVRDDVMKQTNNQQEPFVYGSLGGNDVWLVPPPSSAPAALISQPTPEASVDSSIRRDYELASQVGTKDAWDYFIANYPKGFYSDLARAQSKKLGGGEKRAIEVTPSTGPVASLTPPSNQPRPPTAADIPRLVQIELARVGCNNGSVDGNWNGASQKSLGLFNQYAGTRFDVKIASLDALEVIRGRTGRICPLICIRGYQLDGDQCVKISCKDGYEVGDENTCERIVVRKPPPPRYAPPVATRRDYRGDPDLRPRAADRGGSGQLYCPGGVCRPVARGCHVVNDTTTNAGIMNGGALVCN